MNSICVQYLNSMGGCVPVPVVMEIYACCFVARVLPSVECQAISQ